MEEVRTGIIQYPCTFPNKICTQQIEYIVNNLTTNNNSYNETVNSCDKDNHAI